MADQRASWPRVCVLVLNYNGRHHLEYCLPSLCATAYANYEIVLLDNASSDDSVAFTRANFSQIAVIETGGNLGWARGNNVGIRYALARGADYIVLQNNDTRVDPRWLAQAVQVAEADPRVGFVGFQMLQEYIQGEDPDGARFEALMVAWDGLQIEPARHISGAALFVRAAVFDDVGLIDEALFFYGEEDDLEHRARQAGYKLVRINVPLWHYSCGSSRSQPLKFSALAMRHNIRNMIKNETPREAWRQFRWVASFTCRPGVHFDPNIPHFRRLRPSCLPVNWALFVYAVLWNLLQLPVTLRARRRDERRIAQARRRWAGAQEFDVDDENPAGG